MLPKNITELIICDTSEYVISADNITVLQLELYTFFNK